MPAARPITVAFLIASLAGCATTQNQASAPTATLFTRNNTPAQQQVYTDQECWVRSHDGNFGAQVVTGALSMGAVGALAGAVTAGLLEGKRKNDAHARCMTEQGYTRVTVSAEQARAYGAAKSLDEKAAILGANSLDTRGAATQTPQGVVRTIGRF